MEKLGKRKVIKMKGKIVLVAAVAIILIITNMFASNHSTSHTLGFPSEPHPANAMWIEPSYISLSTDLYDVGYRFNITVWVNITSVPSTNQTITAWQFVIAYNKTQLNVTRCGYTAGDKSEFFSNITTVPIDPQFGSFNETHNYVMHGESWASGPKRTVPGYGSLSWIEFEVIAKPPTGQAHVSLITLITTGVRKSKILDDELNRVSFTPYNSFYSFGQYSVEVPIRGEGNATIRGNVVITKIVVTKNTIHFDVTGPSGYKGWINVTFPMINKTRIKVFLDGNKIPPENLTITSNSTHYFIYFEFTCSTHEITIQYAITNVAITNITLSKERPTVNETIQIYISIKNQGNYTETFDVYLNYTRIYDPIIGTQHITLQPGQLITLNFTWTPTTSGRYQLIAYTSEIEDDMIPADNMLTLRIYVSRLETGSPQGGASRLSHMNLLR